MAGSCLWDRRAPARRATAAPRASRLDRRVISPGRDGRRFGVRNRLSSAAVLALVVGVTPALIIAQTANGARPPVQQRQTAGHDLEGIWNYSSLTPVERPAEFASKATLTP